MNKEMCAVLCDDFTQLYQYMESRKTGYVAFQGNDVVVVNGDNICYRFINVNTCDPEQLRGLRFSSILILPTRNPTRRNFLIEHLSPLLR